MSEEWIFLMSSCLAVSEKDILLWIIPVSKLFPKLKLQYTTEMLLLKYESIHLLVHVMIRRYGVAGPAGDLYQGKVG